MANQTVAASGAATVDLDTQAKSADANLLQYQGAPPKPVTDELRVDKAKPLPLPAPGQIGGYVVDPNRSRGFQRANYVIPSTMGGTTTTITNSEGVWLIAGLPTGNYRVAAEAPGFTKAVKNFHYDANQPKMYSLNLSPEVFQKRWRFLRRLCRFKPIPRVSTGS